MSYELERGEPLGEDLRRICCKQIEGALEVARGGAPCESPVHETRKHLKKARAALRLVQVKIGKDLYRRQDRALRDAGRLISELRDAEVRLRTVQQLERIGHGRERMGENIEAMLAFELENFIAAFAGWQSQALPLLKEALEAVDCWEVDEIDSKQVADAVQQSYKRARKALEEAQATPTAECLHQLRSQAKRLCFQLHILSPINALVLRNLSNELGSVGRLLGQAHDLNFLGERLREEESRSQWQREAEKLLGVVETGEEELQRCAVELGEHFFLERPRDFGKRITRWLGDWQENSAPSLAEELV
jgi:CHAD domain-containing protein